MRHVSQAPEFDSKLDGYRGLKTIKILYANLTGYGRQCFMCAIFANVITMRFSDTLNMCHDDWKNLLARFWRYSGAK